jgi:hypothetical protein
MPALKFSNSGVASKRVRLKRGPCASRALAAVLSLRPSAMLCDLGLSSQLRISQTTPDNILHPDHKALNVIHLAIVVSECLLIDEAEQVKGSTAM